MDGSEIRVGDAKLRAVHTPGHTPGSTCFLLEGSDDGASVLFTGDTLVRLSCAGAVRLASHSRRESHKRDPRSSLVGAVAHGTPKARAA